MAVTQAIRALDLLKSRGMLRLRDFIADGIEPETLARLVRDEQIIRPARGLYQLPDTQIDAAFMFAERLCWYRRESSASSQLSSPLN